MPRPADPASPDAVLGPAIAERREQGLYRRRRVTTPGAGGRIRVDGRDCLNFSANDYLGLAADPRLAEAAREGLRDYGTGSGAAHLITGHSPAHHELEAVLAEFTGRARALLFSTGYMANIGIAQALAGRGDTVIEDKLNHASLLDGALTSRARLLRYQHADPAALAARLDQARGRRLVMTDSVFSMDGDVAPMAELARVCRDGGGWLMADEAHGLGVLGPEGRGAVAEAGLDGDDVPILMGTLGKALGGFGAFVAGSETLIEYLIQHARSYVYTTATPPAMACAVTRALTICREEAWRREKLGELIEVFREACGEQGVTLMPSRTPIQPVWVGDSEDAVTLSEALLEAGFLVQAIRPPTVPSGSARLRVTLSAAHEADQVQALARAVARHADALDD